MEFDKENKVVKLCAKGMAYEGKGEMKNASGFFHEAWSISKTDSEKFIAAHYVARHQNTVRDKLKWDKTALSFALKIGDKSIEGILPSLYLNIGKCYEDLNDFKNANSNYHLAQSYFDYLPNDGYGNMIKNGIISGIQRVNE